MIDPKLVTLVSILLAAACGVTFFTMYVVVIVRTWLSPTAPTVPSQYEYVATALAGLIGAVTAMAFNERLPADPSAPPAATAKEDAAANPGLPPRKASADGAEAAVAALKETFDPATWKQWLALGYVSAYFVCGFGAIATWVSQSNTPNMVKHLALICLGLLLAISRTVLNVPT